MLGIVFTEFLDLTTVRFGHEITDGAIEDAKIPNLGAYTAVGRYDHTELARIIGAVSHRTAVPVPNLLRDFGRILFGRFVTLYPAFFTGVTDAFDFLENVETVIHREVRKLYADADPPRLEVKRLGPDRLELVYRSSRHLGDLAEGLLLGCGDHFKEKFEIQRRPLSDGGIRFELRRVAGAADGG